MTFGFGDSLHKREPQQRKLEYNPGKYWELPYFDKRPNKIKEIKTRSKKFINILKK